MPESSTIPNCVEVRLLWNLAANLGVNVLHAIAPAQFVVNQTTANTLGSAIKAQFSSQLAARVPAATQLVRVGLRDMRTPSQAEFLDTGALVAGTEATSEPLSAMLALVYTLRTAGAGKSFRGRVYIPGWGEAANTGGGIAAATHVTAGLNFISGVQTAMTASGLSMAVASRGSNAHTITDTEHLPDGTVTTRTISRVKDKSAMVNAVTQIESRNASWESQRRRGNGRGAPPTLFDAARVIFVEPAPAM